MLTESFQDADLIRSLKAEIQAESHKRVMLETRIEDITAVRDALEVKCDALEIQLQSAKSSWTYEVEAYQASVNTLTKQLRDRESTEIGNLRERIRNHMDEIDHLHNNMTRIEIHGDEARRELVRSQDSLVSASSRIDDLKIGYEKERNKWLTKIEDLQNVIAKLELDLIDSKYFSMSPVSQRFIFQKCIDKPRREAQIEVRRRETMTHHLFLQRRRPSQLIKSLFIGNPRRKQTQ
jgi:chromosome segregation ATPase